MPGSSRGWAFPAKTNCTGRLGSLAREASHFDIGQNQVGALVGGKAAGKSDGQGVRTQNAAQALPEFQGFAAALRLLDGAGADKLQEALLQAEMRFPQFPIIDVFDPFPDARFAAVLVPARAQMAVVETEHLRRQPSGNVHSIGDVSNGNRVFRFAGVKPFPHGAGHVPVQRGNGIGAAGDLQAQHGHAEIFIRIGGIFPPNLHQAVERQPQTIAQRAQVLFHQPGVESIVARRHGSVGGENHFPVNERRGLFKVQALVLHAGADGLQHGKGAVPLIQVKNPGSDPHGLQGPNAPHPQQQLLANAHPPISAVQAGSQFPVFRSISRHVGVKQQQVASADFYSPHLGAQRATAGFDFHRDRFTGLPDGHFHGQLADVGLKILFPLPAIPIQPLPEIPLAVEKPHPDQRNVEVGSTLDVIAGEDSQAARINGDRFMQTEFRGKVGHRARPQHPGMLGAPGPIPLQILALPAVGVVDSPMQHQFPGAALNPRQRKGGKHGNGIVIELPPTHRIEVQKQTAGVVVPTPPEIARQRPKPLLGGSNEAIDEFELR